MVTGRYCFSGEDVGTTALRHFAASFLVSQIQTPSPDRVCARMELSFAPAKRVPSGLREPLSLYIRSDTHVCAVLVFQAHSRSSLCPKRTPFVPKAANPPAAPLNLGNSGLGTLLRGSPVLRRSRLKVPDEVITKLSASGLNASGIRRRGTVAVSVSVSCPMWTTV